MSIENKEGLNKPEHYKLNDQELKAVKDELNSIGYGEVIIKKYNGRITMIEKRVQKKVNTDE